MPPVSNGLKSKFERVRHLDQRQKQTFDGFALAGDDLASNVSFYALEKTAYEPFDTVIFGMSAPES